MKNEKKLKIGEIKHLNGDEWMIRLDKERYYTADQNTIFLMEQIIKYGRKKT